MATRALVGIDIGTSVVKCAGFGSDGRLLALASRPYAPLAPEPGCSECDMEAVWQLVREALLVLTGKLMSIGAEVAAVGVTGNMCGLWLVDAAGRPVAAAPLWNDGRAAGVLAEWREAGILEQLYELGCSMSTPGVTAVLMKHMAQREPWRLERARTLLFCKDWIRYRLTGELATDPSDACRFPGDAAGRGFSAEVLRLCGLEMYASLLPRVVESGSVAGYVSAKAHADTGLPAGVPVVAGLGDVPACLTGAGATENGAVSILLGTSCLVNAVTTRPMKEPRGIGLCFLLPEGRSTKTLPNQTGTIAQDWYVRQFWAPGGKEIDYKEMTRAAAAVPPGSRGIVFHPYLNHTGVVAPVYEPRARGRLWGLGLSHTRDDVLRAVMEGVALAAADCLSALPAPEGAGAAEVRFFGGGAAANPFWQQLVADATGRRLLVPRGREFGALGVAMLAGVAAGVWSSLREAQSVCSGIEGVVEPEEASRDVYGSLRDTYKRLRNRLTEELDPGL